MRSILAGKCFLLLVTALYSTGWVCDIVEASPSSSSSSSLPEASSTLLKMHRLYLQQPPHDSTLYNVLHVSPNATAAEITKSYRRLTRKWHPDKQRHPQQEEEAQARLERVRQAYEILKDDSTRLPYHRYGLLDPAQAVVISLLASRTSTNHHHHHAAFRDDDDAIAELLEFMGYYNYNGNKRRSMMMSTAGFQNDNYYDSNAFHDDGSSSSSRSVISHQQRVWTLAAALVERIRPLVEGTITDETILWHAVAEECDRLKKLPLGAQIVRCVGRAYRFEGEKYLKLHSKEQKRWQRREQRKRGRRRDLAATPKQQQVMGWDLSEHVRERLRHAKHVLTAAVASGRVVVAEQLSKSKQQQQKDSSSSKDNFEKFPPIDYHWDENELLEGSHEDDMPHDVLSDSEIKRKESLKAKKTLLESLQVEALWKISKIELDRTVREACELVLQGDCFFFPYSYQPTTHPLSEKRQRRQHQTRADGWVGYSSGMAIDAEVGRLRAASALVAIGNVMVQRSKEGTAWME